MKRIIRAMLKFPTYVFNFVMLKRKHVQYGKNLQINGRIHFHGFGKVVIGDDVVINSSRNSNPCASASSSHISTGKCGELIIGNHVGISNVALTVWEKVTIEECVLIGSNCMIADTDFHSIEYENRMEEPDLHVKTAPVIICKGAFVGANCIILKGVTIGEKAVIGAGSVVTKNVPSGEIWAGNPAKFIRRV